MKDSRLTARLAIALLALLTVTCSKGSSLTGSEAYYLSAFQHADLAGVGTAVGHGENSITLDISTLWHGSLATNVVTLDRAFTPLPEPGTPAETNFYGKSIVFFATTNEWKMAIPPRPITESVILDSSFNFTNTGGYCTPRIVWCDAPMWFPLETNDLDHLSFYSNVVKSVVVSRDRARLYTTLRDVIKSDDSVGQPYRGMSYMPMWQLLWTSSEAELVQALNDPLLAPRLRARALSHIKTQYGWPEDSTIPEP